MNGLIFDGHSFDELFLYGDPDITILQSNVSYADSNSRNGSIVIGKTWNNSTVSFTIAVTGSADERRNAFSILGMWLNVDEPKKLVLPDTPDRYYMAIPVGNIDLLRHIGAETAVVSFDIVDPIAYGREVTVNVPSAGSVTFNVGGTAPTKPKISATGAIRDSQSLVYGLRLDNSDYAYVATGTDNSTKVNIDCDERYVILNSGTLSQQVGMITLPSNWLEFKPGAHTLVMDNGTGAATVTYRERWL